MAAKFFVLTWEWGDRSAWGVARVYLENQQLRAEEDLALLSNGSDRTWKLHEVPAVADPERPDGR